MGDQTYQPPKTAEDATGNRSPDGVSPGAVRNFVLLNIGILMLAAWHVYDAVKHPGARSAHFLRAVFVLLLGALAWERRLSRGVLVIKPRWGDLGNHWVAAFTPLLVVAAFVFAKFEETHHQAAQAELALKTQARHQTVQRQREFSHKASQDVSAAFAKQTEAFKVAIETSEKLKLADGKPGFRFNADATRKLEEARDDVNRALERDRLERAKLLQLEDSSR